jgi:F-type H+-transporting ATPase subunit b
MPQFDQISEIYASQLFWLAIFFGAIFVVIGMGMLPKVMSTVDARDAKIAADLTSAEGARAAADALEEEYRAEMDKSRAESARLAADAKASAAKASGAQLDAADKAVGLNLDQAMARIGEARASAMREIQAVAGEAVQELATKVAGLTVDSGTAQAAVAKELAHG